MTRLFSSLKKITAVFFTVLLLTICVLSLHLDELSAETHTGKKNKYNGVFVGKAKRFDHRAFQLMLQKAEEDLAAFNFLNKEGIAASIGKFQGSRFQSRQLNLKATTLPGTSGTEAEEKTDSAAAEPSIPGLEDMQPGTSPAGEFALSGMDLLAQQLALNYKVANLRLLRNLAISDRLYKTGKFLGTRAQVLLGFQVSINPPKKYKNAVAEVKITLEQSSNEADKKEKDKESNDGSSDMALSLMGIFPAKNTYNVVALTQDSKKWGAGAIINVFNIGVSGGKKTETFYMVKDTDTFAIEFPAEKIKKDISFGWQFRPVLGRKSVEPGPRNVFALISLPRHSDEAFEGTIIVETYWRRFDNKSQTAGPVLEKSVNRHHYVINVPRILEMEIGLKPKLYDIEWQKIDNKNAMVTVFGNNFFPGTTIFAGGKLYTEGDGLFLTSENRLSFFIPLSVLLIPDSVKMVPPYGQSINLRFLSHLDQKLIPQLRVRVTKIYPLDEANQMIEIEAENFIARYNDSPEGLHNPLIRLGNRLYGAGEMNLDYKSLTGKREEIKKISFSIPNKELKAENILSIGVPFAGPKYFYKTSFNITASLKVPFSVDKVSFLKEGDEPVMAIEGLGFEPGKMEIIVGNQIIKASDKTGKSKFTILSSTLATLTVKKGDLKDVKQIVVRYNGEVCKIISLKPPTKTTTKPKPKPLKITSIEPISKNDSKSVKVTGENLQTVASVKHDKILLSFKPASDGKSGKVFIPNELTKEVGDKELTFITKDGKETGFVLKVVERKKGK